ncbi:MAG: ABC transporter substrate-binding protein, partial [Acidilobus sp.]
TNVVISNMNQTFVAKDLQYYHYLLSGIAFPVDFFLNYRRWPLSDPMLMQTISMAINRTALDYIAEYGYEPPAIDLPVPPSLIGEFNSTVVSMAEFLAPPEGNVSGAIHWLESHGWKLVNGQLYAPNGTDVSDIQMTIIEPSGEADYDESAVLIADELKAIGLNVVPETLPFSTWFSDLPSGDYWMARFWGMGAVPVAAQQFLARLSPQDGERVGHGLRGLHVGKPVRVPLHGVPQQGHAVLAGQQHAVRLLHKQGWHAVGRDAALNIAALPLLALRVRKRDHNGVPEPGPRLLGLLLADRLAGRAALPSPGQPERARAMVVLLQRVLDGPGA